jgi:hypothetical protein
MRREKESAVSNVTQRAAGTPERVGSLWVSLSQRKQAASRANTSTGSKRRTYQMSEGNSLSESERKQVSLAMRKLGMEFVRLEEENGLLRVYCRPQVDRETLFERIRAIKEGSQNIRCYKEYLLKGRKLAAGMVMEFPRDGFSGSVGVFNKVARETIKEVKEIAFRDSAERHPSMPFQPGAWGGQRGAHPIKVPG